MLEFERLLQTLPRGKNYEAMDTWFMVSYTVQRERNHLSGLLLSDRGTRCWLRSLHLSRSREEKGKEMFDYPEYVIEAFALTYGQQMEEFIEEFVGRWGNLDIETFERVLQEGQGEEKILAIFAISSAALPHSQVRELLLPFLRSAEPRERWASADCLGQIKEEEALPVLIDLLEEGLTPEWRQRDWCWYEDIRAYIPLTLGEWGDASLVPVLRHALHTVWEMEQQIAQLYPTWRRYQAMLSWALGYYGCFGADRTFPTRGAIEPCHAPSGVGSSASHYRE